MLGGSTCPCASQAEGRVPPIHNRLKFHHVQSNIAKRGRIAGERHKNCFKCEVCLDTCAWQYVTPPAVMHARLFKSQSSYGKSCRPVEARYHTLHDGLRLEVLFSGPKVLDRCRVKNVGVNHKFCASLDEFGQSRSIVRAPHSWCSFMVMVTRLGVGRCASFATSPYC
jgi:hypothetical protein